MFWDGGFGDRGIVRLNSDGTRDQTFYTSGGVSYMGHVNTVAIQNDGRMLIGGGFSGYSIFGFGDNIARINTDGSMDSTFTYDTGTGFNEDVNSVFIQDDGKILIGGIFIFYDGTTVNRIARLNSDGSLDSSFDSGFGFNDGVSSITVQTNDKILVGGYFTSFNGTSVNKLVRLNPDGSLDVSFNTGSGFNDDVSTVKLQANGKVLVGGEFTAYNGTVSNKIVRLNSDGSIDNAFNIGTGFHPVFIGSNYYDAFVNAITVQDDDKILVGGYFNMYNDSVRSFSLARLLPNGFYDNEFNPSTGSNSTVFASAIQNDKKIIVGGEFTIMNESLTNRIARLNINGEVDSSFNTGLGFNDKVNSVAIQDDGKVVVVGNFTEYDSVTLNNIARLSTNGSHDQNFDVGTGIDISNSNLVSTVVIQDDNKIIVGGNFEFFNGVPRNGIVRLNTNGSLDASFDPGAGLENYTAHAIAVQDDGKIIVGGNFGAFNGVPCGGIVRLNPNGTVDNTFNSGSGFSGGVKSVIIQNDGKILVGGYFSNFNGSAVNGIIRLKSDGTQDASFDSGSGLNYAFSIVIQNNEKIIVGGSFLSYNGSTRKNIVRLHKDGSIDESFEIGTGFDGTIRTLAFQDNDKLIAGGHFNSYNGIGRNKIARLITGCVDASINVDWSILTANNSNATYQWVDCDNNYAPLLNETSQVFTVTQDGNYAVIVTSNTTNCVDTSACINITNASVNDYFSESYLSIYPNPNHGSFTIETDREAEMVVYNSIGKEISSKQLKVGKNFIDFDNTANGIYYLNVVDKKGNRSLQKVSVMR